MATNGDKNVEDSAMADCDGEKVVTMMDVLQEQQDFEDDANAVLGASDEKNCTYSKGYIKRQAIYACLTCCTEAKDDPTKRAGVCLACSLNCHENHDLIELYTKRNFRCDCGNPKFNSHPCQFTPDKPDLNDDNNYNQNFSGVYCNCHRPYPDPESTVEDEEMIQCIICEDWLHASHLDAVVPSNDQYSEMICKACMGKNEFLHDYTNLAVNVEVGDVDIISVNGTDLKLTNGDLEGEKLINGAGDSAVNTTEKPKMEMDVDEVQMENNLPTESGDTLEKQDLQKPVQEIINSSDGTMEVEKKEEDESQNIPSDKDSESKEEISSAITNEETTNSTENTSEESTKPTDNNSENLNSGLKESNSMKNTEESKSPQESDDTKEEDKMVNKNSPETEISEESSEKSTENMESSEAKDEATEGVKMNPKNLENKEEIDQTTVNNDVHDNSEDSKMTHPENNTETNYSTVKDAETADTDSSKPEGDVENNTTNKIESAENVSTETDKLTNETTPEVESTTKIESNESDKLLNDTTSEEINKTDETEDDTTSKVETNESEITTEPIEKPTDSNIVDTSQNKRKLSTEEAADTNLGKKPKLDEESKCTRPKGIKRVHKGATFWPSNFRQKLCTCSECLSMYKDLSVLFLLDPEDTVLAYETLGKERVDGRATQYEKGLEALSSLDRIQQINALTEYNKMKDKLLDFLKSFKDRKEIVKEEDIKAFFAGMKPKREPDGVYFCR